MMFMLLSLQYLSFLSAFIFLILSLVLFLKKSPIKATNNKLALLLLVLAICTFTLYLKEIAYQTHNFGFVKYNFALDKCFFACIGPCAYIYLSDIYGRKQTLISLPTIFAILALLPSFGYCIYFLSFSANERVSIITENSEHLCWQLESVIVFFYFQLVCYFIYLFHFVISKSIQTHKLKVDTVEMNMSWLKGYYITNSILIVLCTIMTFIYRSDWIVVISGLLILNVNCFYIFIASLMQTGLFKEELIKIEEPVELKERRLLISENTADDYILTLIKIVQEQQLYLQENFTIHDLSLKSAISVSLISQSLNARLNKSFNDFINEFRIELAKKMLKEESSSILTIEAIGLACGFGSKSSFNASFKKFTLQTPSEYRKKEI